MHHVQREDRIRLRAALVSRLQDTGWRQRLLDRGAHAHDRSLSPSWPQQSVRCPPEMSVRPTTLHGAEVSSYYTRSKHCEDPMLATRALFGKDAVTCAQFCKAVGVSLLFDYSPGEVVFDWGFGCGHELMSAAASSAARHVRNAEALCAGSDGAVCDHVVN